MKIKDLPQKLLGFVILIILTSCEHKIHDGEIISKTHEPPRTYTYFTTMPCGKSFMLVPHTGYDDEDFIFTVRKITKVDTIIEDFYVDEQTYHCMIQGEHFTDSIPCELDDDGLK